MRDSGGNYYRLPRAVLEAARVPPEQVAALEASLEPEVTGHAALPGDLFQLRLLGTGLDHADAPHHDVHFDIPHH